MHATHVEAPALDAEPSASRISSAATGPEPAEETAGEWEADESTTRARSRRSRGDAEADEPGLPAPESLTPMGNRRTG